MSLQRGSMGSLISKINTTLHECSLSILFVQVQHIEKKACIKPESVCILRVPFLKLWICIEMWCTVRFPPVNLLFGFECMLNKLKNETWLKKFFNPRTPRHLLYTVIQITCLNIFLFNYKEIFAPESPAWFVLCSRTPLWSLKCPFALTGCVQLLFLGTTLLWCWHGRLRPV